MPEKQAKDMMYSIYDESMREPLRQYTRDIVELVSRKLGLDVDMVFDIVSSYDIKKKTKKQKVTKLGLGVKNNQTKTNAPLNCEKVLEYIVLEKGEFLFDPVTCEVYSYSAQPIKLGVLDLDTNILISC